MSKQRRFLRFHCVLDDSETLRPAFEVVSAEIKEALSEPYELKIRLTSKLLDLIPMDFIQQPGVLILNFGEHQRYFHGIIGVFKQLHLIVTVEGETVCLYEAYLYPKLWFLKFNKDYRIFQEKSTLTIVENLFHENKLLHVIFPKFYQTSALEHADPVRPYCVQYGESDFDFISRLLEDRGFYYYFDHHKAKHILKLAFNHHDHTMCNVTHTVEIAEIEVEGNDLNKILTYEIMTEMFPQHQAMMDYNYQHSKLEMIAHRNSMGQGGTIYEYPGGFSHPEDGRTKTHHLTERDEGNMIVLSGKSMVPFFSPGFKFTLSGHPNKRFDDTMFTLKTVHHYVTDPKYSGSGDRLYYNTFSAFLSTSSYRPDLKTPKPKIHGTQTAIVVAPQGEEVWTDEQGRVKVQFHWNHRGYRHSVNIHSPADMLTQHQQRHHQYRDSQQE